MLIAISLLAVSFLCAHAQPEETSELFILYRPPGGPVTWEEARDVCLNRYDSGIASIHTNAEQNEARDLFNLVDISENVWFGLNDRRVEGNYQWDDGTVFGFDRWAAGEPRNTNGRDCASMNRGSNFRWRTQNCDMGFGWILCNRRGDRYDIAGTQVVDSWTHGLERCKLGLEDDSTMAIIRNEAENRAAIKICHRHCRRVIEFVDVPCGCWLGLSDAQAEGVWLWADGTSLGYSNWADGQPDNCCAGEHYAHMWQTTTYSYDYKWNDLDVGGSNASMFALCDTELTEEMCCEYFDGPGAWERRCPRFSSSEQRCTRGNRDNFCKWDACGCCSCNDHRSEVECLADQSGCTWHEICQE